MVGDDRTHPPEPERGDLRQHFPFVRDAGTEHVVEGRDAIGRDDDEAVAEVVNVPDLASTIGLARGERGLENERGKRQHDTRPERVSILQGSPRADNNNI